MSNMPRSWEIVGELLEWHPVADGLPDADLTVLLWVVHGNERDWASGWHDGESWRACNSGGIVAGTVTHWADPEGPAE